MQVGGDDAALHRAVDAVAGAVARALGHRAQRLGVGAQNRSAAVVFEARQRLGQPAEQRFGDHLADGARRLRRRRDVEQPDPVDAFPAEVSYQCPSTWMAAQIASTGRPALAARCSPG